MLPIIMAYFEPLTEVIKKTDPMNGLFTPQKITLNIYNFLLAAQFCEEKAFYTDTNSTKTDDQP